MIDADEIMEECDIEEILEKLDVTLSPAKGINRKCLCPFHVGFGANPTPDHDYGSCGILDKGTFKGIHCFVCGKTWSVFQIVQARLNCNYIQAMQFVYGKPINNNSRSGEYEKITRKSRVKCFAGTSSEISDLIEIRKVNGPAYKNIDDFINEKSFIKEKTLPEYLQFENKSCDFDLESLPKDLRRYLINTLLEEREEINKKIPQNEKEYLELKENYKLLKSLRKLKKSIEN